MEFHDQASFPCCGSARAMKRRPPGSIKGEDRHVQLFQRSRRRVRRDLLAAG
jgi:hypothetical protein